MERRKSKAVLDDYFQILRLDDLIRGGASTESKCPICDSEMVAAEGADEPYYWRCVKEDCYTRNIDQPYPFDGMLRCNARDCDAPVELGYWGGYPHWRCTANSRHHQKMYKAHLRLPKMAELIPKSEQRKVCAILGIPDLATHLSRAEGAKPQQATLFEDSN